jgi:hypothetical protein
MKSLLPLLLASLLAFGTTADAREKPKPLFVESADQNLPAPPADAAQIVFLEPINKIQGLFPVGLFEIQGDQRKLLAISGHHSKTVVNLAPGHHTLMANQSGMIAHFLDADVEAGKRYYVLLRFIYAHGFQLRPIRTAGPSDYALTSKDYPSWNANTHFVESTPEGVLYFETTIKEAIDKSQAKGWAEWQTKTAEERAELTLTPQDAIAP